MEYSEKIKQFMKVKGLNNRDLANKLKRSDALVGRWINAEKPSMDFLLLMIDAFPDFDLNYTLKKKPTYNSYEDIPSMVANDREEYGKTAEDIITEIEGKLTLLKQKVAQNSHK